MSPPTPSSLRMPAPATRNRFQILTPLEDGPLAMDVVQDGLFPASAFPPLLLTAPGMAYFYTHHCPTTSAPLTYCPLSSYHVRKDCLT